MEENANKLQFNFTTFNSSMRVSVYAECIYVLAKYLKYQAFKGIDFCVGKMWVALKRAGCCVVAFGGYVNCACVPLLFQQLINTMFVQLFQEIRLSTSLLCTSLNTNCLSKFCPRR